MSLFKLSHIIVKYLRGENSTDEEAMLNSWLEDDIQHQELIGQLQDEERLVNDLKRFNQFDVSKAWGKFESRQNIHLKKNNMLIPFLRVAAVAALIVSVSVTVYFLTIIPKEQVVLVNTIIEPGSTNAILKVNDEKAVSLTDSASSEITKEKELIASVKKGQISYGKSVDTVKMTVQVPLQSEYQFVLADGTKVWMNAASKVEFKYPFATDRREIFAEGEVYLEVAKDAERPFIVNLPTADAIQVLGTQFNVMAYPGDQEQQTVLVEGSILWRSETGKERILEPGQLLVQDNFSKDIEVKEVDVYQYIAWKDGRFVYEGETLENIMKSLSRWYGVEVAYEEEVIKDLHFSVDVRRYEQLNDILSKLQLTEKVYFEINGSTVLVSKHK
ncbi:FecR family protein [Carboxylicivirga sp. RSCT41]|uniref:FecR family protein n=1 Tax=Carboxylicivirga agarovorans TaxID=3417570 RepID=UPI003D334A95